MFGRKAAYAFTFLLLGGASAAHAVTYDAFADFSTVSNPNRPRLFSRSVKAGC